MTGIQSTKPIFGLLGATITALANIDTNDDGIIQFAETANAVQTIVIKALPAIGGISNLKAELTDLDELEKEELVLELSTELDLENDVTEVFVERTVGIVLDIADLLIEISQATATDDPGELSDDSVAVG